MSFQMVKPSQLHTKTPNIAWRVMATKFPQFGMVKHTYTCMTGPIKNTIGIVLKMISAPMWPLGKSKKIFDNYLKPVILYV